MGEALKTFSFPVGGIADFYLEDHEKEALYKEKAQENFGSDGLGAIQDVAWPPTAVMVTTSSFMLKQASLLYQKH
jgi:hypothetical protein